MDQQKLCDTEGKTIKPHPYWMSGGGERKLTGWAISCENININMGGDSRGMTTMDNYFTEESLCHFRLLCARHQCRYDGIQTTSGL